MNNFKFPVCALVGQESVGKSTLFNKLTRTHYALISNSNFGLTRDRRYGWVQYKKYKFILIDTGGFNRLLKTKIQEDINEQTILAIKESDVVLFVVNGRLPISSIDYDIVNYLRQSDKKVFMVVNKIDSFLYDKRYIVHDYYTLGIKNAICVSAFNNHGIDKLLSQVCLGFLELFCNYNNNNYIFNQQQSSYVFEHTKNDLSYYQANQLIKLAVIGRPNSGKSTFINYILNENRMITSEKSGTTRDSMYVSAVYNNQKYILIDTAGVRKKKRIQDLIEQISVTQTLQVIQDAHITLFMIDINEGVVDQDITLLKLILKKSIALIIVVNKWDVIKLSSVSNQIRQSLIKKLSFFSNVPVYFISSLRGNGIEILFQSINKIYFSSMKKSITTAWLTRTMHKAINEYPPPFLLGSRIMPKPKYVHIGRYNPTLIVIHGTQVTKLSDTYKRYLKRYFYRSLNIKGMLINLRFKDTINPFRSMS